jgi:polygalacturonase
MRIFFTWSLICLAVSLRAAGGTNVFDVRQFGAVGGGKTFDTIAIQKALDACEESGGTVEFPPGNYLSQPLTIYSKTIFQVDAGATLWASTNQSDFMKTPGDWLKAKGSGDFVPLIGGKDLTNVTFTGGGTIDGHGFVWWPEAEKARQIRSGYTLPRPVLIGLDRCKNVRMENLTLQNSPKFHFVPADCDDVVISNVTVLAPEHAANTDAFDPSGRHFLITKCKFDVGDDDIAIKGGKKIPGRDFQTEDFLITDCTFLHGHGMSIGSETYGGVRNVSVKNCTFENTENGLRIKSDERRGGRVENISYENITMSNVAPAITLTCVYQKSSSGDAKTGTDVPANPELDAPGRIPAFRNIRVTNLKATSLKSAGLIVGLPESCISNVVFENVEIFAPKGMTIRNARRTEFKNSKIQVDAGATIISENAEVIGLGPAPKAAK